MKKYLILLIITSISISSFSQNKFSEHYYKRKALFENTPDTNEEVIFLGNSITEGGNWSELFPDVNAINRGISGDVTNGILFRLDEITSSQPKKVFLLIGINDLARGKSINHIAKNTAEIIQKIKSQSPKTKIFVQSVLPVNPNVGERFKGHKSKQNHVLTLNKKLKKIARKSDVKFLNIHKCFKNSSGELNSNFTIDGLHLTLEGYQFWKKTIQKHVFKK